MLRAMRVLLEQEKEPHILPDSKWDLYNQKKNPSKGTENEQLKKTLVENTTDF
jgi:hypothetical protein